MEYINKHKRIIIAVAILVVIGLVAFVFINRQKIPFFAEKKATNNIVYYPKLDRDLNEVLSSKDMKKTAKDKGLDVSDAGMKAVIKVNNDSFIFTADYGQQDMRYGRMIQAIIRFDALKKLATHPKVSFISGTKAGKGYQ